MQELVKAFEDLIMLKSLMQSTENLLRRQYRREQEAEAFANMRAWLNNPISYLQQALAAHKAKPTKEDVENWINNGFDAKKIYQNGRKYGFEEGFSVGRKSAGLEDIKVQFEEPPIKKPALSEDELVDIIHKTVQRRVPFESVIPSIIKALRDAGVLNVRESNPLVIQYKMAIRKDMKMKSDTSTIISALRILAVDIKSDDGVANACIFEAADRLEELQAKLDKAVEALRFYADDKKWEMKGYSLSSVHYDEGKIAKQTLAEIGG